MRPTATPPGRCRRLAQATRCTAAGLWHALRSERAFQEEVLILIVLVIPGALWLGRTGVERALLVGSWLVVLAVELLNAGIERAVDRIGTEHHELSGQAKDLGSAAVGLAILMAMVVWGLVLLG